MKSFKLFRENLSESVKDLKNWKDRDRKGFEAMMQLKVVKGNTSNKFDDNFGFSQSEMGAMDKVMSKIKGMHISSFDGGDSAPASLEFYGSESSLAKFLKDSGVQKIIKKYKARVNGPHSYK